MSGELSNFDVDGVTSTWEFDGEGRPGPLQYHTVGGHDIVIIDTGANSPAPLSDGQEHPFTQQPQLPEGGEA